MFFVSLNSALYYNVVVFSSFNKLMFPDNAIDYLFEQGSKATKSSQGQQWIQGSGH